MLRHLMPPLEPWLKPPKYLGLVAAISMAALFGALYFQYVEGLEPCRLCLLQRVPYVMAIYLAFFGMLEKRQTSFFLGLLVLVFLANSVLAFYHTGVEQHWWADLISCAPQKQAEGLNQIMASFQQTYVPCDEIPWTFLGLSMAAYNTLLNLGLTVLTAFVLWQTYRKPRDF